MLNEEKVYIHFYLQITMAMFISDVIEIELVWVILFMVVWPKVA